MQLRDLHRQYQAMKGEMDEAILRTASSGNYIMGAVVEALEQRLADYVGVRHCVSCANGTDALRLSVMALGIGPGDAVFVPDFTFFATAEAVALHGATPIFVDVCEDDFNIDVDDLLEKIDHVKSHTDLRPAAVIAVDLFGQPADFTDLTLLCEGLNLHLIEDGAQGFGGSIYGKRACSFGDISTTSFFPAKPLGCYGDGGALFTDNDDWAALLRSLRAHGKGSEKYDNIRIGLNSRLDALQAAVLQVKLKHFDDELAAVNRIAQSYNERLRGKVATPIMPPAVTSSFAQYTIQTDNRDALQARLKAAGIASAVYYPRTMSHQAAFAPIASLQQPCPVSERLTQTVLSLPMHPYLTEQEIELVTETI